MRTPQIPSNRERAQWLEARAAGGFAKATTSECAPKAFLQKARRMAALQAAERTGFLSNQGGTVGYTTRPFVEKGRVFCLLKIEKETRIW